MSNTIILCIILSQILLIRIVEAQINNANNDSFRSCPNHYFLDNLTFQCLQCDSDCALCSNNNCKECQVGRNLDDTCLLNTNECLNSSYFDLTLKRCVACTISFCLKCSSQTQCMECEKEFTLSKDKKCIYSRLSQDKNTNGLVVYQDLQTKNIVESYSCPFLYYEDESNNTCIQQKMCSFQYINPYSQFTSGVKQIIQYKNLIIALSSQQTIVYDEQVNITRMNQLFQLTNLVGSQDEYARNGMMIGFNFLIFTNQYIWVYNINYQRLNCITQFQQEILDSFQTDNFYWFDEQADRIFYLSLNKAYSQLTLSVLNVDDNSLIDFKHFNITVIDRQIIYSSLSMINQYEYFPTQGLIVVTEKSQVNVINLLSLQTTIKSDRIRITASSYSSQLINFGEILYSEQDDIHIDNTDNSIYILRKQENQILLMKLIKSNTDQSYLISPENFQIIEDQSVISAFILEFQSQIYCISFSYQQVVISDIQNYFIQGNPQFFYKQISITTATFNSQILYYKSVVPLLGHQNCIIVMSSQTLYFFYLYTNAKEDYHSLQLYNEYDANNTFFYVSENLYYLYIIHGKQITMIPLSDFPNNLQNALYNQYQEFSSQEELMKTEDEIDKFDVLEDALNGYNFIITQLSDLSRYSISQIDYVNGNTLISSRIFQYSRVGSSLTTANFLDIENKKIIIIFSDKTFSHDYYSLKQNDLDEPNITRIFIQRVSTYVMFIESIPGVVAESGICCRYKDGSFQKINAIKFPFQLSIYENYGNYIFIINQWNENIFAFMNKSDVMYGYDVSIYEDDKLIFYMDYSSINTLYFTSNYSIVYFSTFDNDDLSHVRINLLDQINSPNPVISPPIQMINFFMKQLITVGYLPDKRLIYFVTDRGIEYSQMSRVNIRLYFVSLSNIMISQLDPFEDFTNNQEHFIYSTIVYLTDNIKGFYIFYRMESTSPTFLLKRILIQQSLLDDSFSVVNSIDYGTTADCAIKNRNEGFQECQDLSMTFSIILPNNFNQLSMFFAYQNRQGFSEIKLLPSSNKYFYSDNGRLLSLSNFPNSQQNKGMISRVLSDDQVVMSFSLNLFITAEINSLDMQINVYALDTLTHIITIPQKYLQDDRIYWNDKYQKLIIIRIKPYTVFLYDSSNLFQSPLHIYQLSSGSLNCSLLNIHPLIACTEYGLYNYLTNESFLNSQIYTYISQPTFFENTRYIFLGNIEIGKLICFDTLSSEYSIIDRFPTEISSELYPELILFDSKEMENQAGFKSALFNFYCLILELPTFKVLKKIKLSLINKERCYFIPTSSYLIIQGSKTAQGIQLPFKDNLNLAYSSSSLIILQQYYLSLKTKYIYLDFKEPVVGQSVMYVTIVDLTNGKSNTIQTGFARTPVSIVSYSEEKQILVTDQHVVNLIDGSFMLSFADQIFSIVGVHSEFNYMITKSNQQNQDGEVVYSSVDISSFFPFTQSRLQWYNQYSIKNENFYDEQSDIIVYMNYKYLTIEMLNPQLNQFTMLRLQERFKDKEELQSLKTYHRIFKLDQSANNTFGLFFQCQIVIFQFDQSSSSSVSQILFEKYLLDEFKCNIYLLSNKLYYFDFTQNQLFSLHLNLNSVQQSLVYKSNQQVLSLIKVTGGSEDYLLLTTQRQINSIILINTSDDTSIEINDPQLNDIVISKAYIDTGNQNIILGSQSGIITELTINNQNNQYQIISKIDLKHKITNIEILKLNQVQIYVTTRDRVFLIQKVVDENYSTTFFKVQLSQSIHTTQQTYLKVINSETISVYGLTQVSLYSTTLELVGVIQESLFIQITNVLISTDKSTIIVQDSQGIYVFNLFFKHTFQKMRLKLITSFLNFIIPNIMKIVESQNQINIVGVDSKQAFELRYEKDSLYKLAQNNSLQNKQQYSSECTFTLKEYQPQWQQKLQYIDIVNSVSGDIVKIAWNLKYPTQELFIPTSLQASSREVLKQLQIDATIFNTTITLGQNQNINQYNVGLLKIQNGVLRLIQPYKLKNMVLFQLKDITVEIESLSYLRLESVKKLVIENVNFIIKPDKNTNEFNSNYSQIFEFISVNFLFIKNVTFSLNNNSTLQKNMFYLKECQTVFIKDVTLSGLNFSSTFIYIYNNYQAIQIDGVNIARSIVGFLFRIEIGTDLSIKNITLTQVVQHSNDPILAKDDPVSAITKDRLLESEFITNVNNKTTLEEMVIQSLISISYCIKQTSIELIRIRNSTLLSFLNYNNTYTLDISETTYYNLASKSSSLIMKDFQVTQNTLFLIFFIAAQETQVHLLGLNVSDTINPSISIQSATDIAYFEDISFIENNSLFNPFIQMFDSQFYSKNLNFTNNENKNNKYYQAKNIEIFNSNFIFISLTSRNSNLGDYFLGIMKSMNTITAYINLNFTDYDLNSINNMDISGQLNGGLIIESVNYINISFSNIYENKHEGNGAGIHIKNTQNCILQNVTIRDNNVSKSGGGIYLEDSDLEIYNSLIYNNKAKIGGGIRYLNQYIYPKFLSQDLSQIVNNQAQIFGNDYGSNPTQLKVISPLNNLVSSLAQKKTIIIFQLYGEDGCIVNLQNQKLKEDIKEQFYVSSSDQQILIQKDSENSNYQEEDNVYTINTYLADTGYSQLLDYKDKNEDTPSQILSIKSKTKLFIPVQGKMENQFLNVNISISFRDCVIGEVVKKIDSKDHYECFSCEENSYSLVDPYSNNMKHSCIPCPKGSQLCVGNKIVPQEQYWRDGETDHLEYCENNPQKCTQINTVNGCKEGGIGPLCESCDYNNLIWKEHFYGKKNRYECSICGEILFSLNQYLFPAIIGICFILYIIYQIILNQYQKITKLKAIYLNRAEVIHLSNSLEEVEKTQVIIKILISYFQLISIVQNFNIRLPDLIKKLLFFLGNTMDTTYYSLDCLFIKTGLVKQVSMVYLRLLWSILTPLIYLVIIMMIFIILRKTRYVKKERYMLISGLCQFYYMFYTGMVSQIFGTISYRIINQKAYVLLDVQYESFNQEYIFYNAFISLPVVAFILLVPVIIYKKLKVNKDNLLNIGVYISYGFFFSEYKQSFYFWEIVKMWQKIIVYIIINTFNQSNVISSIIISITIIFYMKFQSQFKPFQFQSFNELDNYSQVTAILTIFFCLANTNTSIGVIQVISIILVVIVNILLFSKIIYLFFMHRIRYKENKFIRKVMIEWFKVSRDSSIYKIIQERNFYKMNRNWTLLKYLVRSKKLISYYYDSQQRALLYQTQQLFTKENLRYQLSQIPIKTVYTNKGQNQTSSVDEISPNQDNIFTKEIIQLPALKETQSIFRLNNMISSPANKQIQHEITYTRGNNQSSLQFLQGLELGTITNGFDNILNVSSIDNIKFEENNNKNLDFQRSFIQNNLNIKR